MSEYFYYIHHYRESWNAFRQVALTGRNGKAKIRKNPYIEAGQKMKLFEKLLNPREIRKKLGLNQQEFWTKIGVTQSGGSRYESGRNMPKPVKELLRLVYVEDVDLSRVKKEDFDVIDYLKTAQPDLYKQLKKDAKTGKKADGQ